MFFCFVFQLLIIWCSFLLFLFNFLFIFHLLRCLIIPRLFFLKKFIYLKIKLLTKNRILFMGLYRDDEIADSPFMKEYEGLKREKNINMTNICLPALTKSDITNMMMVEMRLPR